MLGPTEIRSLAERKYSDVLRSIVSGQCLFPLFIRFGKPNPTADFAALREQVTSLNKGNFGYTIEWEEKNTRRWGKQPLPSTVRFDTEEQFITAIGKSRELEAFKWNVRVTLDRFPTLQVWLKSHVRRVVEFEKSWAGILNVCEFFIKNPRPNLYTRELPVAVHTKFIEEHREILGSVLQAVLPETAISRTAKTFEERFGLKTLQPLVRFRLLDPSLMERLNLTENELGLPLERFRAIQGVGLTIIITENLMTLECLPQVDSAFGVWGQGNAAELLLGVDWFLESRLIYWGDIDEHGFHILSRLRAHFPGILSCMMDRQTLCDVKGARIVRQVALQ